MNYALQHGKVFLLKRNLNCVFSVDGANVLLLVKVSISVEKNEMKDCGFGHLSLIQNRFHLQLYISP